MAVYHKVDADTWTNTAQYHKVDADTWNTTQWYLKRDGEWIPVSYEVIDDFEDGNANAWSVDGSGTQDVTSPGMDGTDFAWRHDQFTEAHLAGANAVDRGPQPSDVIEFWFHIGLEYGGEIINRFEFSADGLNDSDKYRIEWERNTADTELSIEKIQDNTQVALDTDEGFEPLVGVDYRAQVAWNIDGTNNISVDVFDEGGTLRGSCSIADNSTGEFAEPGIYVRTNNNCIQLFDQFRIIP